MIPRERHEKAILRLLRDFPVVAILGARQVGKTTLAQRIMKLHKGPAERFDLEDPVDLARLDDPRLALSGLRGLVVLDEPDRIRESLANKLCRGFRVRECLHGRGADEWIAVGAERLRAFSHALVAGSELRRK